MYEIVTSRETYSLGADGKIGRPEIKMLPSGKWLMLGLYEYRGFGGSFIPLADVLNRLDTLPWKYKNGKERFHIRDLDHGTVRQWGESVTCIRRVTP
jgi:hypothetical protein